MPLTYTRKFRRYAIRKRKRSFRRRPYGSRALRLSRSVKPEVKSIVTNVAQVNLPATGTLWLLNAMDAGYTDGRRIGNKILTTGLSYKGFILNTTASSQVARVIMFKWMISTPPTLSALMQSASINSPYYVAAAPAFRILKDIKVELAPAGQEGALRNFKCSRKVRMMTDFTAGTAADWLKGVVYILAWSTSGGAGQIQIQFDGVARYIDA